MKRLGLFLPLASVLLAGPAFTTPAPGAGPETKAMGVLARTKSTRITYALYLWNRISRPGEAAREEWSAEFHSGDLHRVETPRDRLVANCRTGEGWALSVETGQSFEGPWIARTACGIDTNQDFLSAEWQGTVSTQYGPADRVRLVTGEFVKTYDVSPDGILLGCVYADKPKGESALLVNRAVGLERALPAPDMFTRASLARSYVPDRYTRPPALK